MKKIITLIIAITIQTLALGQNNPKAESILKKVTTQLEQQKNISLSFNHTLENKTVNIKQTSTGSAIIQGDAYSVNYLDNIILFDTNNLYVISPENEEINITASTEILEESMTPSKMLYFYKKGYTYQLSTKSGDIQYLKLTPTTESEEISHIILGVNTIKNQIVSLMEVGTNGTNTTFTITAYQTNLNLAENTFVFDKKKYLDLDYYINE